MFVLPLLSFRFLFFLSFFFFFFGAKFTPRANRISLVMRENMKTVIKYINIYSRPFDVFH